jgi:glycosyltransferase involved in cell wall biosynthesis
VKNCSNVIPNIQLVVIGASAERRNLNWLSKKLGIEKKVWFVGEQEDLIKWFDSFDLYFSLSNNPNLFDLETALLAMSRGVPVVVFHHGAFQDFISDGESGFIVEPGKVEALTGKLIDIEPDKHLLKKVGLMGQSLVLERLNRKAQVEKLKSLFS